MQQIYEHAEKGINIVLIGNKFDLAQKRVSIFYILK
jgi:hypothetical protein